MPSIISNRQNRPRQTFTSENWGIASTNHNFCITPCGNEEVDISTYFSQWLSSEPIPRQAYWTPKNKLMRID